jgi:hypothetical protein
MDANKARNCPTFHNLRLLLILPLLIEFSYEQAMVVQDCRVQMQRRWM